MNSIKTNYHTHTARCGHAVGADEDYVISAICAGITELGFSDHTPWPFAEERKPGTRMELSLLEDYVRSVAELREKYKDRIRIRIGLECEYFEDFLPWLRETKARYGIEYLLFGNHFADSRLGTPYFGHSIHTPADVEAYTEVLLRGMDCPDFAYIAHPDLFMRPYDRFDEACEKASRRICEKAAQKDLLLEFNISGYAIGRRHEKECYPHDGFWRIAADCGCRCILGFDAHDPRELLGAEDYARGLAAIRRFGLRRVEALP